MDIVSVAAPKRRRRRKQGADMAETAFIPQFSYAEGGSVGPEDPPAIVGEIITSEQVVTAADEIPPSRDIGNWRYTPWKGKDMWTHLHTGLTTFDEGAAKHLRHRPRVSPGDLQTYATQRTQRERRTTQNSA